MRYLINTICIALLLWGCDNITAASAKPTVVRKKIVAPKTSTARVRPNKSVRTAKKPAAKQQTKTLVANVDKPRTTANDQLTAKKDANVRRPIASQPSTGPVSDSQRAPAMPKKPAISPKSAITSITPAADNREQPDDDKPEAAKESNTTGPLTASTGLSDGLPPIYDGTGKIDPFEPLFREQQGIAKKTKKKIKRVPRTPLERIDLAQLKLVGIILAASGNRALVEESSGKGYVIKKGTYIGTNGGKIVKIQKERVYVEEKFEDVFGKIQTRQRELKLPKPPGEF